MGDPVEMQRKINNGTKHIMEDIENSALLLMTLMMVSSCSLIPTKQVEVSAKPMERTIVQPIMPREIDLKRSSMVNYYTREL